MRKVWHKTLGLLTLTSLILITTVQAAEIKDDDFKSYLEQDVAHLSKNLKDGAPTKNGIKQAKAAAMMIAMSAQLQITGQDKAKDAKMATLRDNAVKVAEAVLSKKYAEAVEISKLLTTSTPASPTAKTEPVELEKKAKFDMDELMKILHKTSVGGLNIEIELKEASEKLKDVSKIPVMAARLIAIAEYTEKMPSETGAGKKSLENWKKLSVTMKDAAKETYEASKTTKPDLKKIQTSLGKLNASCTECHNVFK
jgi:hypothetical protein